MSKSSYLKIKKPSITLPRAVASVWALTAAFVIEYAYTLGNCKQKQETNRGATQKFLREQGDCKNNLGCSEN